MLCLCYRIASLDKANEDHDDGDNKKDVDEPTEGKFGEDTQKPENDEDDCDSYEHKISGLSDLYKYDLSNKTHEVRYCDKKPYISAFQSFSNISCIVL